MDPPYNKMKSTGHNIHLLRRGMTQTIAVIIDRTATAMGSSYSDWILLESSDLNGVGFIPIWMDRSRTASYHPASRGRWRISPKLEGPRLIEELV